MKFDQEPVTSGGKFLKIVAGSEVNIILRGEVKTEYIIWDNKKKIKSEAGAPGAKFSFAVNVALLGKDGSMTPQVWESGATNYKALKDLSEDYQLDRTIIKIKRTGSGMNDTVYSIVPLPKPPTDQTMAAIEKLEMLALEDESAHGDVPNFNSEESIPF